jgi:hypothetical protein
MMVGRDATRRRVARQWGRWNSSEIQCRAKHRLMVGSPPTFLKGPIFKRLHLATQSSYEDESDGTGISISECIDRCGPLIIWMQKVGKSHPPGVLLYRLLFLISTIFMHLIFHVRSDRAISKLYHLTLSQSHRRKKFTFVTGRHCRRQIYQLTLCRRHLDQFTYLGPSSILRIQHHMTFVKYVPL